MECGKYYRAAEEKFRDIISARTKLPPEFCASLFRLIDGHMMTLPNGFEIERFPNAFLAASMALDAIGAHSPLDSYTINNAWNAHHIGKSIFKEDYSLFPGVREMLELLSKTDTMLILNTKGPNDLQRRKISINAINQYFDDVVISLTKNKAILLDILIKHDLLPEEVLCVGDSARDDIMVPQDLGCWTVWINDSHPDNYKPSWVYEEGVGKFRPNWWTEFVADLPKVLETSEGPLIEFLLNFKQPIATGVMVPGCSGF